MRRATRRSSQTVLAAGWMSTLVRRMGRHGKAAHVESEGASRYVRILPNNIISRYANPSPPIRIDAQHVDPVGTADLETPRRSGTGPLGGSPLRWVAFLDEVMRRRMRDDPMKALCETHLIATPLGVTCYEGHLARHFAPTIATFRPDMLREIVHLMGRAKTRNDHKAVPSHDDRGVGLAEAAEEAVRYVVGPTIDKSLAHYHFAKWFLQRSSAPYSASTTPLVPRSGDRPPTRHSRHTPKSLREKAITSRGGQPDASWLGDICDGG